MCSACDCSGEAAKWLQPQAHPRLCWAEPLRLVGIFRILQGDEICKRHSAWIDAHHPALERFAWTLTIEPAEVGAHVASARQSLPTWMRAVGDDAVLCLPTAPGIAPKLSTPWRPISKLPHARLRIVVDCRP